MSCVRVRDLVSGRVDPSSAHVVLVDRLWPRGVRKESLPHDEWCKAVAPSTELRREFHGGGLDFDQFAEAYRAELSRAPAADAVNRLVALATDTELWLAYASRDTEHNHALILAEVIRSEAR